MKHLRFATGIVLLGILCFCWSPTVRADVNDFTVTNFTADYYLGTADPQGALAVTERISVDFSDQNHGILRALPQRYDGHSLRMHITNVQRNGTSEPYTTYISNGNTVLKIGDPNRTITGVHHYTVSYNLQNVIHFGSDGNNDELIWNTNGTEWQQPFNHITARLHLPATMVGQFSNAACYTGTLGSKDTNCTVNRDGSTVTFTSTGILGANQTMTFAGEFPQGTFHKPTTADWWRENGAAVAGLVVPPIATFAIAYRYWRTHGKDIKGRGTIIPEYGPPKDLRAAEADAILRYGVSTGAISATIIDLAIRGHIRIVESQTKGVFGLGKHKVYTLERLQTPRPGDAPLRAYETKIMDTLFASGGSTELSSLKNSFYKTVQSLQKDIPASLTTQGFFPANPKKVGIVMYAIAGVMAVVGLVALATTFWTLTIGFIVAAIMLAIFAKIMPKRTQKGVDAKDNLAGLKLYMQTAEKDRIAMMQSPNAPYAAKTTAPKQTVQLFEKLLPFAMIMGVEKQWAKQFENIYTTPPDWYSGNWAAFNAGYLTASLHDSMSAMNTSFAPPSSSGSGSGGGFSGGGGGGGGGGGW